MTRKVSIPKVRNIDGKDVHPLLLIRETYTPQEMAKALGHANHTTVSIYCSRARKAKNTKVPAEWVLPLCKLASLQPSVLRPDLYLPGWKV